MYSCDLTIPLLLYRSYSLGTSCCNLHHECLRLRSIHYSVRLFNFLNRHLIFTMKILCLTLAITDGYAAIAHFSDHLIFGILYYMLVIDSSGVPKNWRRGGLEYRTNINLRRRRKNFAIFCLLSDIFSPFLQLMGWA